MTENNVASLGFYYPTIFLNSSKSSVGQIIHKSKAHIYPEEGQLILGNLINEYKLTYCKTATNFAIIY
jgi:hypothetical protein